MAEIVVTKFSLKVDSTSNGLKAILAIFTFFSEDAHLFSQMLSSIDWLVLTIDILLFTVTLPLYVIYIFASLDSRQYHPNLRILEINWSIFLLLIQLGPFIWTIQALIYQELPPNNDFEVYTRIIVFYGMFGMRILFHSLIVERTFATFLSQIYEKRKLSVISIPLVVSAHIGGFTASYLWNGTNPPPLQIFWLITVIVDFAAVILVARLAKYNSRLHTISLVRLQLSQRFQVIENIRSLRAVYAIVTIGALSNLLISSIEFTCFQLQVSEKYVKIFFYVAPVGFATAEVITAKFVSEMFKKRMDKIWNAFKASVMGRTVETIMQVPGDIKNVFGTKIVVEETINKRFEQLQKQWG